IQTIERKSLFLDLVEKISHEFYISSCWICGDIHMAEIWPWEGIPLSPQNVLRILEKRNPGLDVRPDEEVWSLKSEVIGEECILRRGPKYIIYVGEIPCKRYYVTNHTHQWWIPQASSLYWSKKQEKGCSF
ncbi:ENR1 protein, partial [Alaudala cheleensis]|nr:ENR1 protein [Alaudala cheleensis]